MAYNFSIETKIKNNELFPNPSTKEKDESIIYKSLLYKEICI